MGERRKGRGWLELTRFKGALVVMLGVAVASALIALAFSRERPGATGVPFGCPDRIERAILDSHSLEPGWISVAFTLMEGDRSVGVEDGALMVSLLARESEIARFDTHIGPTHFRTTTDETRFDAEFPCNLSGVPAEVKTVEARLSLKLPGRPPLVTVTRFIPTAAVTSGAR
jgi:hypothetical protein